MHTGVIPKSLPVLLTELILRKQLLMDTVDSMFYRDMTESGDSTGKTNGITPVMHDLPSSRIKISS